MDPFPNTPEQDNALNFAGRHGNLLGEGMFDIMKLSDVTDEERRALAAYAGTEVNDEGKGNPLAKIPVGQLYEAMAHKLDAQGIGILMDLLRSNRWIDGVDFGNVKNFLTYNPVYLGETLRVNVNRNEEGLVTTILTVVKMGPTETPLVLLYLYYKPKK